MKTKEEWQLAIDDYKEITVRIGIDQVVLEYIGEGYSGDYSPDDPEDVPLLRFSCSRYNVASDEWEELPNSSYCTHLSVDEDRDNLLKAARNILDCIQGTDIYNRKLQEMSWLDHNDFPVH